eukprot:69562-Pyramimonas_sp.AAC.1
MLVHGDVGNLALRRRTRAEQMVGKHEQRFPTIGLATNHPSAYSTETYIAVTVDPYHTDAREGCRGLGDRFRSFSSRARQTE